MLYRRIFTLTNRWFKFFWWLCTSVVVAYCLVQFGILLAQCSPQPVSTLWDEPSKCFSPEQTSIHIDKTKIPAAAGFVNAFIDLCTFLLPVRMVCMLQMTFQRKLLICGLLMFGLL